MNCSLSNTMSARALLSSLSLTPKTPPDSKMVSEIYIVLKFYLSLLVPYCLSAAAPTGTDHITSCLTHHNIKNFTTIPGTGHGGIENDQSSTTYYELLNFSRQ